MKKTIYFPFLIGYTIFAILSILSIRIFGYGIVHKQVLFNNAKEIYDDANIISEEYNSMIYGLRDYEAGFSSYLKNLTGYLGYTAEVVSPSGDILYSSDPEHLYKTISDFDSSYFGSKFYTVGNLNGYTSKKCLIVTAPIIHNYLTEAYIIAYEDHKIIHEQTLKIVDRIYMLFAIVFLISFIIIIVFTIKVYKPIKLINTAALEYAKGNFTYSGLKYKSPDEIGTLATSIEYMAQQFKNLEDDEKKFMANVSHDFRSPLTSIKGYLEAILDGTIPVEIQDKYLNIVLSETERLTKLTNNLLTLNAYDNAGNKLDISEFDINTVIKETLASFEGQCEKKKIMIDVVYGAKSYIVSADKGKIQQVLYNLIDNAIKFSHQNSTVYINVTDKNGKIFVSIKDTGIGIPKDNINKIWERFYKSDNSRGKDKTGTGLGLSIVKEIITNHNENINVISTEGAGTEFIFSLKCPNKTLNFSNQK